MMYNVSSAAARSWRERSKKKINNGGTTVLDKYNRILQYRRSNTGSRQNIHILSRIRSHQFKPNEYVGAFFCQTRLLISFPRSITGYLVNYTKRQRNCADDFFVKIIDIARLQIIFYKIKLKEMCKLLNDNNILKYGITPLFALFSDPIVKTRAWCITCCYCSIVYYYIYL